MIWVVQNCANIISGREALYLISLSVIATSGKYGISNPQQFLFASSTPTRDESMASLVVRSYHVHTVGTCTWDACSPLGRLWSQFNTYGNHWSASTLSTELFPVWQLQLPTVLGYATISGLIAEVDMQMFRRLAFAFIAQKFRKRQWGDTVKVVSRGTPRSRMAVH